MYIRMLTTIFALALLLFASNVYSDEANDVNGAEKAVKKKKAPQKLMTYEGKGHLVGTSHFPLFLFTDKSGKKMSLSGPFLSELKRLENIGLRVKVKAAGKNQGHANYDVYEYEIIDVGKGVKPYVGKISVKEDEVYLIVKDTPQTFLLTGNSKVLEKIKEADGGKAWIKGEMKDGKLRVRKFNIIRKGCD